MSTAKVTAVSDAARTGRDFLRKGVMTAIAAPVAVSALMTVIDKDGWPQPAPWKCDTLNVAPVTALIVEK